MKRILAAASLSMLAGAVLMGCSAGGKQSSSSTTPTTPTAADLLVTVSTPSASGLKDTGTESATVTVTAVDANRNVVAAVPVSIVPDGTAVVSTSSTTTSTSGVVTGTIGIGTDKSNRTVTVLVSSGSLSKTVSFQVVGATLTATLTPAVIAPGAAGSITYHLTDANGVAIAGANVALSGDLTGTGPTDPSGNFVYNYTAPSTESVLTVNAVAANAAVTSAITDTSGSIGAATIPVQSASLSTDVTTVLVNTANSTTNQVNVRATFLGANNQPIPNIRVRFDLDGDVNGIGGTLSSGSNVVYSDANGIARTIYTPGSRSSGNNKLTIRGCWDYNDFAAPTSGGTCPNGQQITQSVTVSGVGVSLAVLSDNNIVVLDTSPVVYQIGYAVQVVDSAGNPVPNTPVSSSVDLPHYFRGAFGGTSGAFTTPSVTQSCDNEDVNRNGVLDVFANGGVEDANGNGILEPAAGGVTIVAQTQTAGLPVGTAVTDKFGRAYYFLQYGANYAFWEDATLSFSTTVSGTEGHKAWSVGRLPFPASVLSEPSMPFEFSPWGVSVGRNVVTVTDPATNIAYHLCQ
ncbi:MAG: hypothetical protein ACTHL8_22345 [Burkholderiaceae bacterium]